MLRLSTIVKRLRQECDEFERRVAGTATFSAAMSKETLDIKVPCAFIIPMYGQDLGATFAHPDLSSQDLREYFAVAVCLDNRENRAGAHGISLLDPLDQLVEIQESLRKAFKEWHPFESYGVIRYARDSHLGMSNTRIWHQFEWFLNRTDHANANQQQQDKIDEIVNSLDNEVPDGERLNKHIERIYVTGHEGDGNAMPSVDDFWMPRPTHKPNPTEGALQEKREGAEKVHEVSPTDPLPPDGDAVDDAATKPTPPEGDFYHGPKMEE